MEGIISPLSRRDKEKLVRNMRRCQNAQMKVRYLIVLACADGASPVDVAAQLKVSRSTVYRVVWRFVQCGESGLADRREDNGERKIDEDFLTTLIRLVGASPQQYGWSRPTWTRELLVLTMWRLAITARPRKVCDLFRRTADGAGSMRTMAITRLRRVTLLSGNRRPQLGCIALLGLSTTNATFSK